MNEAVLRMPGPSPDRRARHHSRPSSHEQTSGTPPTYSSSRPSVKLAAVASGFALHSVESSPEGWR